MTRRIVEKSLAGRLNPASRESEARDGTLRKGGPIGADPFVLAPHIC